MIIIKWLSPLRQSVPSYWWMDCTAVGRSDFIIVPLLIIP